MLDSQTAYSLLDWPTRARVACSPQGEIMKLTRLTAILGLAALLGACGVTPQPSLGAENTPNGVQVYGTIDLGVGKTSGAGTGQR